MSAHESVSKVKKTYWVSDKLSFEWADKMATDICLGGPSSRQKSSTDLKRLYFTSIVLSDVTHSTVCVFVCNSCVI